MRKKRALLIYLIDAISYYALDSRANSITKIIYIIEEWISSLQKRRPPHYHGYHSVQGPTPVGLC
jgi:hypothetical protein